MEIQHERRRHPRVRLDGRMTGRATIMAEFRVMSISETGALIEVDTPLALGSRCDLTLNLPHVSVDLKGRVVHVEPPPAPGGPFQVGVSFLGLEALDRGLLESFLDRERRRAL